MLRISKLTDYSTVVMSYLAREPDKMHNARDIMAHTQLNLPTISKILKMLHKAGLLRSQRGANGGYSLIVPPENISITQILAAMEGNVALTECSAHHSHCTIESICHIRTNWRVISRIVQELLSKITLADMLRS